MTNNYYHGNDFLQAAFMLAKLDATRTAAYDLADRTNEDGSVNLSPEKLEEKRQASNQKMRDSVYGKGAVRGTKDAITSAAGNIADRAKGAASSVKDKVMGTEGTDAADADINRRFSKLTGGDPSADPEGVFQGDPGIVGAAKDMGNRAQDNASSAMTTLGEGAKAKLGQAKDAMTGAAEKIGQGYSNMASNVVPKVDAAMMGAAEKIGQGVDSAKTWAGDMNAKYNTPENRTAAWEGAKNVGSKLLEGAKAIGRGGKNLIGATAQGASDVAGRMAYGAVDPATGQRTGRDASGFINPNDKLGTLGAGIKGAVTGKGAMNAIEERNQKRLSTNDLNFDREEQTKLKQGVQSADAEGRWRGMPGNVHEGMEIAGQTPAAAPTPGDADGDGVPDVEETRTTATDGATGEVTETHERTVTPPAPATTPTTSSGGGGMSSGGGGMSSGTPTTTSAAPAPAAPAPAAPAPAPAPAAAAPSQSNKIAENALASEQAGKLSEANQRAGKSWADGGIGTGIVSNLLTVGGAGALRHGANALTRFGGRRDAKAA